MIFEEQVSLNTPRRYNVGGRAFCIISASWLSQVRFFARNGQVIDQSGVFLPGQG
jgi:hypothetical protein